MVDIDERRRMPAFMRALYEATNGNEWDIQDAAEIGKVAAIPSEEIVPLVEHLQGEFLVMPHWTLGGEAPYLQISHAGVVEVEEALRRPDEPTEHFAALGSLGVASGFANETVERIDRYRAAIAELAPVERANPEQQLSLLEAEVTKPVPHQPLVDGLLSSLARLSASQPWGDAVLVGVAEHVDESAAARGQSLRREPDAQQHAGMHRQP